MEHTTIDMPGRQSSANDTEEHEISECITNESTLLKMSNEHEGDVEAASPPKRYAHASMFSSMINRFRTVWLLRRSNIIFAALVYALQIILFAWYLFHLGSDAKIREALGWGAIIAKGAAGALYPTMFFVLLSMSKWTITFLRSSSFLSRAIQFDNFHWFHIHMAVTAFILAWIHSLGHLSGTYVSASEPRHNAVVVEILGPHFKHATYATFITTLPAITGILAIFFFSVVALGSTPMVKKWRFEAFQYSHWCIVPYIALLMFHGAARELAFPIMPFVIAIPTLLLVMEKLFRLCSIFGQQTSVYVSNPDDDIMHLTIHMGMMSRMWPYRVGQYILIRVPAISNWEWHPFTIARREHGFLELHIKKAGQWTQRLAKLGQDNGGRLTINVEGPYGAPAQSFYDFDHSLVIATGVGVTPSSAILNSLALDSEHPWTDTALQVQSKAISESGSCESKQPRYADFLWTVPEQHLIPWFAKVFSVATEAPQNHDIRLGLKMFVTRIEREALSDISKELEQVLPVQADASVDAGRPDYATLFDEHYAKMQTAGEQSRLRKKRLRIGVFFCGNRVVANELRRLCFRNTLRGVAEGTGIEYHFHPEVF